MDTRYAFYRDALRGRNMPLGFVDLDASARIERVLNRLVFEFLVRNVAEGVAHAVDRRRFVLPRHLRDVFGISA
ncbi:MAG: hypothetical protein U5J64_06580 [Halobacteriales archaeon]|nr:hypothetical protein [Halobacteriales archaeon]